ncbi:GNAT family N-acetyltransferase [Jatrophihabitans sp. DSM 45814]
MNHAEPQPGRRPHLAGPTVSLRPGGEADIDALASILAEPSVVQWWGTPEPLEELTADLLGSSDTTLLVIEVDREVVGGIQYLEEREPRYRHASIDIFIGTRYQNQGIGTEAIKALARFLLTERGHHRLTIDPAAANTRAIRCYSRVGFRPVGLMRRYERHEDGTFHDGLLMDMIVDDNS